jgi:long-chain acyl-CoA synthetase
MTTLSYFADESVLPTSTLTELFFKAVDEHASRIAFERMVSDVELSGITYSEAFTVVKKASDALGAQDIVRGDRAAILSENRPEWALADYACLCAGVIDVPIYPTLTPSQVAYALKDSGAKLVFASSYEQVIKALEAVEECPQEIQIVVFDSLSEMPAGVLSWEGFLELGVATSSSAASDEDFRKSALEAQPDDVATIIYTSGTTGDPKGVMLTHNNISSNVEVCSNLLPVVAGADNTVSFLPLSHILQRTSDYLFFRTGCRIGYPRSIPTLIQDMGVIRPTVVVSVPRIYEKIYNNVMGASGIKKALINWAAGVADRVADLRLTGREPSGVLALQYGLADKLVFSKVKAGVGGRVRLFLSGGGPLAPVLNRFFYSIGLTILEGYGLTETSPVTNANTLEHFRIGSVGKPAPGTEVKIASDGEILIRGPQVMKGYYNKPEATASVIDTEGWFATGDIGHIDGEGFLYITDRKKDLIVTGGGKNIAPQPIENRLKTNMFVEQAVILGDRRPYLVLLIVPAVEPLQQWASQNGIEWSSFEELVSNQEVLSHLEMETLGELSGLASFETPKKIALLSEELSIENGMLTPTLKVKRSLVEERFEDIIEQLYTGAVADKTAS